MKKLLMAILLGTFFICASSANAAQDLKNVLDAQQETSDTESLANKYERAGKKEDAKKAWEALVAKNTNDTAAYGRYADALIRMGDAGGAIAQLEKAQQFDPNNSAFYTFRITEILAANNKQDEAKAILTKLMNETKDNWVKENVKSRLEQMDILKNTSPTTEGGTVSTPMMQQPPSPGSPMPGAVSTPMTQSAQQTTVPVSAPQQSK
nr:tetratricopeptide repeat protein [Candidatus Omnitrophota bacterium]